MLVHKPTVLLISVLETILNYFTFLIVLYCCFIIVHHPELHTRVVISINSLIKLFRGSENSHLNIESAQVSGLEIISDKRHLQNPVLFDRMMKAALCCCSTSFTLSQLCEISQCSYKKLQLFLSFAPFLSDTSVPDFFILTRSTHTLFIY